MNTKSPVELAVEALKPFAAFAEFERKLAERWPEYQQADDADAALWWAGGFDLPPPTATYADLRNTLEALAALQALPVRNQEVSPSRIGGETLGATPKSAATEDRYRTALRNILFLRPGGPCRNKLIVEMENIARDALEGAAQ